MADIREEQAEVAAEEREAAQGLVDAFSAALDDARGRMSRSGETVYDTADPVQNARADLLVQYLVRPGFADAHAQEAADGHYHYRISVDWRRLQDLAESLGHHLPFQAV